MYGYTFCDSSAFDVNKELEKTGLNGSRSDRFFMTGI